MSENENHWNDIAAKAAQQVHDECFEAHRGAIPYPARGLVVVFGNDGHGTDRVRREVEEVRRRLPDVGCVELGFGVERGGYSWALVCRPGARHVNGPQKLPGRATVVTAAARLDDVVWEAWVQGDPASGLGASIRQYQQRLANTAILALTD